MGCLKMIADNWQKLLPVLVVLGIAAWVAAFRNAPASERALFAALLVIYMAHQIEEHLWPGGFRQFANARVFRSGRSDWPVDRSGVALVNVGYVWLPLACAIAWPGALRWVGFGWLGLTFVNALTHIVSTFRFRGYNPGLVTSIVLFLPFTIWAAWHEIAAGLLSGREIGWLVLAGVLLHAPVAALFVNPFWRGHAAPA